MRNCIITVYATNISNLIVNFKASGDREIIWHVFKWGKYCEILAPKKLREVYKNYLKENLEKY